MRTVSLREAQSNLTKLIEQTPAGDSVVITRDDQPVAQLVALPRNGAKPVFGSCRGAMTIVAEDDEHIDDFAEYR